MSGIKRMSAALCLAALLVSGAAAEDLIAQEDIVQESANYKTYEVIRGDFVVSDKMDLTEYYPKKYEVAYEGDTAYFVEFCVKRGDEVKEGQLLATLYYQVDEVRLQSLKLSIQRAQEALEEEKKQFEEEMGQWQARLSALSDLYERRLAEIEMEKRKTAHEQSCYVQEYAIARQQEELQELTQQYEQAGVYSPMDGVVESIHYKKADDFVYDGEALLVLNDPNTLLFTGDSSKFRYNMPVSVEMGHNQSRYEVSGRVVCADNVLPPEVRNGLAYVQIDELDPETRITRPVARADTTVIRNVLLAERKTVNNINGSHYVTRLENETPKMRYVKFGKSNSSYVWILQGVSEGDRLIDD